MRITYLGTPLPLTLLAVVIGCGLVGMAIERVGLRPLQNSPRIAPLLSTIGIGLVLDQVAQLLFTPDPRGVPSQVPDWRTMIGGMGNVPGAIAGSLLLGLIESYGIAAFGTSYRNLFAFVVKILILVFKPNGLFARGRSLPPEPLTGTFIAPSAPLRIPLRVVVALAVAPLALP